MHPPPAMCTYNINIILWWSQYMFMFVSSNTLRTLTPTLMGILHRRNFAQWCVALHPLIQMSMPEIFVQFDSTVAFQPQSEICYCFCPELRIKDSEREKRLNKKLNQCVNASSDHRFIAFDAALPCEC